MKDLLRALLKEGLPATRLAGQSVKVGPLPSVAFYVAFYQGEFYVNDATKRAGPLLFRSKDIFKIVRWLRERVGVGPHSETVQVPPRPAPVLGGGEAPAGGPA